MIKWDSKQYYFSFCNEKIIYTKRRATLMAQGLITMHLITLPVALLSYKIMYYQNISYSLANDLLSVASLTWGQLQSENTNVSLDPFNREWSCWHSFHCIVYLVVVIHNSLCLTCKLYDIEICYSPWVQR